jgi:hypothetical protein
VGVFSAKPGGTAGEVTPVPATLLQGQVFLYYKSHFLASGYLRRQAREQKGVNEYAKQHPLQNKSLRK